MVCCDCSFKCSSAIFVCSFKCSSVNGVLCVFTECSSLVFCVCSSVNDVLCVLF